MPFKKTLSSTIIDSILAQYNASFYDNSSPKVFVSGSQNSLIAYESNQIGIPYARDITILTTKEDEHEVFSCLEDLLQSKTKWVHVAISVNKGVNEDWFQQRGFHLLRQDNETVRYAKILNKTLFKHLKEKYVCPPRTRKRLVASDDVHNVETMAI